MQLFDTHAHIGLIHTDPMEQLLVAQRAKHAGVKHIVSICNSLVDFAKVYENLSTAHHVYHTIGVSPSEVNNPGRDWEQYILSHAKDPRIVAIGEIGLDYYRKFGSKDAQLHLFARQLEIAEQLQLPVVIHNRDAGDDVLEVLQSRMPSKGVVLHCYSENWKYAKRALALENVYISFAGNVTYKNAKNLHETAAQMPLDRMLVETESPFMVPSKYKGKRNTPSYLHATVEALAEIRELETQELADTLWENSLRFFGLPQ